MTVLRGLPHIGLDQSADLSDDAARFVAEAQSIEL